MDLTIYRERHPVHSGYLPDPATGDPVELRYCLKCHEREPCAAIALADAYEELARKLAEQAPAAETEPKPLITAPIDSDAVRMMISAFAVLQGGRETLAKLAAELLGHYDLVRCQLHDAQGNALTGQQVNDKLHESALNWIRTQAVHASGCDSWRNWERDCDCGLYELRGSTKEKVA